MNYLMTYLLLCTIGMSASESSGEPQTRPTHHRRRGTVALNATDFAALLTIHTQSSTSPQAPPPSPSSEPENILTRTTGARLKDRPVLSPTEQRMGFALFKTKSQARIAQDPLLEQDLPASEPLPLKQKSLSQPALNSPGDFLLTGEPYATKKSGKKIQGED